MPVLAIIWRLRLNRIRQKRMKSRFYQDSLAAFFKQEIL